jgi:hypothetical protein
MLKTLSYSPDVFYPKRHLLATLRKQVTYFTLNKTWSTEAQLADTMPLGWRGYHGISSARPAEAISY